MSSTRGPSTEAEVLPLQPASAPRAVGPRLAVIIPSYRVRAHILSVLQRIGPEVERIYVVDDCCPEGSGEFVTANCGDPRVVVLRHPENQGVGGAVMTGYARAIADGLDILVKIDGDGQMDPGLLPHFVRPLVRGVADYAKGNRFYDLTHLSRMPLARLVGNAGLSFLTKLSTGYWNIFDPTNGYTAIHATVARHLPFAKISRRYFFETDLLFRLSATRAVVVDVPMDAKYGDERSNLRIGRVLFEFGFKHLRNFLKRIFYSYFLREMNLASLELVSGLGLFTFGAIFGAQRWLEGLRSGVATPTGTIMLAALPLLIGHQQVLAFLNYDIQNVPRRPVHEDL